MTNKKANDHYIGTYIDLFSGCGGLSLGLGNAGWKGIFAVEKDPMAFSTFRHNLIESRHTHFTWPKWLPIKETTIQEIIKTHNEKLKELNGTIDLIAGGPPCQGFSLAGKRNESDPRNRLSDEYIKMVELISPRILLLENVRGFNSSFKNSNKTPYSMLVRKKLEALGYVIFSDYICSADFGVPQKRTRFIMIGIRKTEDEQHIDNPFLKLNEIRDAFLKRKSLPLRHISVREAIEDLQLNTNGSTYHSGNQSSGFKKINYSAPKKKSRYLRLMREGIGNAAPNSLRLARHRQQTIDKFNLIQRLCTPGVSINDKLREVIGTKKQAITVLHPDEPSKTLTTLPDDLLHYSEPRILTVREMARIQSFPDRFKILGKYTTGGKRRTKECPRYTQIGNAVPPLLAEALGELLGIIKREKNE